MFLSEINITSRERVYVAVILVGGSSWQPHWDDMSALKIFWGKGVHFHKGAGVNTTTHH